MNTPALPVLEDFLHVCHIEPPTGHPASPLKRWLEPVHRRGDTGAHRSGVDLFGDRAWTYPVTVGGPITWPKVDPPRDR